jgi:Predicted Fe-S oxidoreductases
MIQQVNNASVRRFDLHEPDIQFLKDFYDKNGEFPAFTQVLIETRTDCNNHCPFCPHAFNDKTLGVMSIECYQRIIDQLCKIGYNGRVALMLSNEPLLEDRLEYMVKYAKSKSPRLFLDITTNGRLLTLDLVDHLFEVGIDNININDYRGDRTSFPNKLSSNLVPIYEAYSNNPKISFIKRRFDETLPNYGGNIPQEYEAHDFGFCNFPFRKLVISFKGDVLLCCNDFMYATKFGNVMKQNILDCWNGESLNKIRKELLNNNRVSLCSICNDSQDYNTFKSK